MLLMWNSKIQIDGGKDRVITASVLEVRNLVVLRVSCSKHYLSYLSLESYLMLGSMK